MCVNFLIVLCMSNTLELLFLSRSLLHRFELSHTTVPKFSHETDETYFLYLVYWYLNFTDSLIKINYCNSYLL